MASKKKSTNKPGPFDDIARAAKTVRNVGYEVSGAGDVMRFARNPSLKTAASLGLSVAAYAAGPAAKAAQGARAAKAAQTVRATKGVRAAEAAKKASSSTRVVKAYKGAGTVTTKAGSKANMTGIKTFSTGKNPARAAASTRSAVEREARTAGARSAARNQKKVTRGKIAAASLASAKGASTVSTQKQKQKNNKK